MNKQASANRMTSRTLSIILAPTLAWPKHRENNIGTPMLDLPAKSSAIQLMIDHCHQIFN